MDELLLTLEAIRRRDFEHFKMQAALQGVEVDDPFETQQDRGDEDLPEELKEMERKYRAIKEAKGDTKEMKTAAEFAEFNLGYGTTVAKLLN